MPIVDYFEVAAHFELPAVEALAFFNAKGLKATFDWRDMLGDEHDLALTVAKMMDMDLLATVKGRLDKALARGDSLQDFKRALIPELQAAGWWGKQDVIDPLTGQVKSAQLGSASRLETIFRTNLQSAYAVGRWQAIETQADQAPYLLYDAVDDHRTRPEHQALDGLVLTVDDPFWNSHSPPNGWNCRCGVIPLDGDQLTDHGLKQSKAPRVRRRKWVNPRTGDVQQVPVDLDPGWDHNPGKARYEQLKALAAEKAQAHLEGPAGASEAATKLGEADAKIAAQVARYKAKLAKLSADQPALKGKLQAQVQKLAQGELAHHLGEKTAYLAQAIKQIQGTQAGKAMSPYEQLSAAKDKALVIEQSAQLSGFKAQSIKGKKPSAKQQAAFDTLPDEAKASMIADIEAKSGIGEAKAELETIAAGQADKQPGLKKKLHAKWQQDGTAAGYDNPKALLQAIEAEAGKQQAKAEQSSVLSGYKKKILAGQVPTPKQKAVFGALSPEEQASFLAKVDQAKAKLNADSPAPKTKLKPAPEPESAPSSGPPPMADLTQIGGQGGSNPGGLYQDVKTGTQWYVKRPQSDEQARNEVLTGKLYEAAGVEVPEMHWRDDSGGTGMSATGMPATGVPATHIYSKIIDGMQADAEGLKAGKVQGVLDNFVVDAWLANWDVVGLGFDNLLVKQGRAIRIDTGAGLLYRAQGTAKGGNWNDQVGEIDSLRDAELNPQAAAVFQHVTQEQLIAGARKVLSIDAKTIEALVDAHGPGDAVTRKTLVSTLKARQAAIAKRFPEAVAEPRPAGQPTTGAVIAPQLDQDIRDARVNGVAMLWDQGDIEDHNVRFTYLQDGDGKPVTRVALQLSEQAAKRVYSTLKKDITTGDDTEIELVNLDDTGARIKALIIGINAQAKGGNPLRDKDLQRLKDVNERLDTLLPALKKVANEEADALSYKAQKAYNYLAEWRHHVNAATRGLKAGAPARTIGSAFFQPEQLPQRLTKPKPVGAKSPWVQSDKVSYAIGRTERSHLRLSDGEAKLPGSNGRVVRRREGDHAIDFYPAVGNNLTMSGKLYLDIEGEGDAAGQRAQALLDELGVDTSRPDAKMREELYLDQMAYVWTTRGTRRQHRDAFESIGGSIDQRIAAKQAMISQWNGHDITKSRYYQPDQRESHQAFGHGRRVMYRADWPEIEVDNFARQHRLYHNPVSLSPTGTHGYETWAKLKPVIEGGGQLTSLADRLRRGLTQGDTSPDSDFNSGGANYVFTRIQQNQGMPHTGVFFKADRLARRVDAISYSGDKFGNVSDSTQRSHRAGTISELRANAQGSSNEMIFKDGLSLFEDVDVIVLYDKTERDQALADLKQAGYEKWPDGRKLTEVIKYRGQN